MRVIEKKETHSIGQLYTRGKDVAWLPVIKRHSFPLHFSQKLHSVYMHFPSPFCASCTYKLVVYENCRLPTSPPHINSTLLGVRNTSEKALTCPDTFQPAATKKKEKSYNARSQLS